MMINLSDRKYLFDPQTKDLLLERDFKYFLDLNHEIQKYKEGDMKILNDSYHKHLKCYKKRLKKNRQFQNYLHGKTVQMFEGGGLPAHFHLDSSRHSLKIYDFHRYGEMWAIFHLWKKHELSKRKKEKIWDKVLKLGSLLGIALAIIKLFETVVK